MGIFKWTWFILVANIAGRIDSFEISEYNELANRLDPLECFALGNFLSTKGALDPVAASAEMTKLGGNGKSDGYHCGPALLVWKNHILPRTLKGLNKTDENFEKDTLFRGLKQVRRWDLVKFLDKNETTAAGTEANQNQTKEEAEDREVIDVKDEENFVDGARRQVLDTPSGPEETKLDEAQFSSSSTEDAFIPHPKDAIEAPANGIADAPAAIPVNPTPKLNKGGLKQTSVNQNAGNFKIEPKFTFVLKVILIGITALIILLIVAGFLFTCLRKRIEDEEFDLGLRASPIRRPISPNYYTDSNNNVPLKLASAGSIQQAARGHRGSDHANANINNNSTVLVASALVV